jgi:hypothetical protein
MKKPTLIVTVAALTVAAANGTSAATAQQEFRQKYLQNQSAI